MTLYRSRVTLPDSLQDFLSAFTGQGRLEIIDPYSAVFEYEAEDLWEAASIAHDVEVEVSQMFMQPTTISKPENIPLDHRIDVEEAIRNGEDEGE
jgi:hypothetical protein